MASGASNQPPLHSSRLQPGSAELRSAAIASEGMPAPYSLTTFGAGASLATAGIVAKVGASGETSRLNASMSALGHETQVRDATGHDATGSAAADVARADSAKLQDSGPPAAASEMYMRLGVDGSKQDRQI